MEIGSLAVTWSGVWAGLLATLEGLFSLLPVSFLRQFKKIVEQIMFS